MANRKELRDARRKAVEAARIADEIAALPRRVGQQVIWSNGVIWTRVGDDQWQSQFDEMDEPLYPSVHIVMYSGFWRLPHPGPRPIARRCKGVTTAGRRCAQYTRDPSEHCAYHRTVTPPS